MNYPKEGPVTIDEKTILTKIPPGPGETRRTYKKGDRIKLVLDDGFIYAPYMPENFNQGKNMNYPKEGPVTIDEKTIRRMYKLVNEHEEVRNQILRYFEENYAVNDDHAWKILKKMTLLELVEKYAEERINVVKDTYEDYLDDDGYNEPNGA